MDITKAVIYARVSSAGSLEYRQNTDRQVQDLKEYAGYKGYELVEVFNEHISGAKKNNERPILVEAIDKCKELTEIGDSKVILLCSERMPLRSWRLSRYWWTLASTSTYRRNK